jgi:hypothetical protein
MLDTSLILDDDYLNALLHLNLSEQPIRIKTANQNEYYSLIKEVAYSIRELNSEYVTEFQDDIWNISKNLLSSFEKLKQLGLNQLDIGNKVKAYELLQKAYTLYQLFTDLSQKMVAVDSSQKTISKEKIKARQKKRKGVIGKLGILVQKVIDCCIE